MVRSRKNILLKIQNLTVYYGPILALQKVNLEVLEGEIVALLGSNGSGKSSLLKTIMGIKKPRDGKIFFKQNEIQQLRPENRSRNGIYFIPEDGGIFRTLTVQENLQLGAYGHFNRYKEKVGSIISLFPVLNERMQQIAGTLSGGEQRLLAIGKALMSQSKFLMMDEPLLGLSPVSIHHILKTVYSLNQNGYTILLSEQNVKQMINNIHRIYVLKDGKIALEGKPAELKNHPGIEKAYLGS